MFSSAPVSLRPQPGPSPSYACCHARCVSRGTAGLSATTAFAPASHQPDHSPDDGRVRDDGVLWRTWPEQVGLDQDALPAPDILPDAAEQIHAAADRRFDGLGLVICTAHERDAWIDKVLHGRVLAPRGPSVRRGPSASSAPVIFSVVQARSPESGESLRRTTAFSVRSALCIFAVVQPTLSPGSTYPRFFAFALATSSALISFQTRPRPDLKRRSAFGRSKGGIGQYRIRCERLRAASALAIPST